MPKTPGLRQIGFESTVHNNMELERWYLISGNGKRICQGCWHSGGAKNSAVAFAKLMKDKPAWLADEAAEAARKEHQNG